MDFLSYLFHIDNRGINSLDNDMLVTKESCSSASIQNVFASCLRNIKKNLRCRRHTRNQSTQNWSTFHGGRLFIDRNSLLARVTWLSACEIVDKLLIQGVFHQFGNRIVKANANDTIKFINCLFRILLLATSWWKIWLTFTWTGHLSLHVCKIVRNSSNLMCDLIKHL